MTAITNGQIAKVARGLTVHRDVFAQAYDDVASWQTPMAAQFKTIAQVADLENQMPAGADRDAFHYRLAMLRARDEGWLVEFVFEKFPDLAGPDPDEPPGTPADDKPEEVARAELQSIAHRQRRFQEGRRITTRSLAALRRCCIVRIERANAVGDEPQDEAIGSGFLIGPNLVLTNHHVIQDFVDAVGMPVETKDRLYVQFDYHAGESPLVRPQPYDLIREDRGWLLAHSSSVPVGQAETPDSLAQHLDYAVLILDGRPGYTRGYYDLDKIDDLPKLTTQVQLWQFPAGKTTRMAGGDFVAPPVAMGFDGPVTDHARLYHTANSMPGASGGLLLRENGVPMGLHDAGFPETAPEDARKNRCVPLSHIARDAQSLVTQEIRILEPKIGWHERKHEPILGRSTLQKHIRDATLGRGRIITVLTAGGERVGKLGRTYTRTVLEACLPPDKHHFVSMEASLIDPNPYKTARRIATMIDADFAKRIPPETVETTMDADAAVLLVERTVGILRDAAPGKTLWLFIDDIDADPIGTQWGSSSYLIALYRSIAESDDLRVVLSGLPRRLEGLRDLYEETGVILEEELIAPPSRDELNEWVAGHLTNRMHPDDFAPGLAGMVEGLADRDVDLSAPRDEDEGDDDDASLEEVCRTQATNRLLSQYARLAFNAKAGAP